MKRLQLHLRWFIPFLLAANCLLAGALMVPATVTADDAGSRRDRAPGGTSFTLRPQGGEFIQRWLVLGPVGTEPGRTNASGTGSQSQSQIMQTDYLAGVQGEAGVWPQPNTAVAVLNGNGNA